MFTYGTTSGPTPAGVRSSAIFAETLVDRCVRGMDPRARGFEDEGLTMPSRAPNPAIPAEGRLDAVARRDRETFGGRVDSDHQRDLEVGVMPELEHQVGPDVAGTDYRASQTIHSSSTLLTNAIQACPPVMRR